MKREKTRISGPAPVLVLTLAVEFSLGGTIPSSTRGISSRTRWSCCFLSSLLQYEMGWKMIAPGKDLLTTCELGQWTGGIRHSSRTIYPSPYLIYLFDKATINDSRGTYSGMILHNSLLLFKKKGKLKLGKPWDKKRVEYFHLLFVRSLTIEMSICRSCPVDCDVAHPSSVISNLIIKKKGAQRRCVIHPSTAWN